MAATDTTAASTDAQGGEYGVPESHGRLWTADADELIIHDRENADAWVQSSNAVDLRRWA